MHLYIVRMHILCKYFFVRIVVDLFAGPFNCLNFSLELCVCVCVCVRACVRVNVFVSLSLSYFSQYSSFLLFLWTLTFLISASGSTYIALTRKSQNNSCFEPHVVSPSHIQRLKSKLTFCPQMAPGTLIWHSSYVLCPVSYNYSCVTMCHFVSKVPRPSSRVPSLR